jgi:hypothetical protein
MIDQSDDLNTLPDRSRGSTGLILAALAIVHDHPVPLAVAMSTCRPMSVIVIRATS